MAINNVGILFYGPRDKPTSSLGAFQAGCFRQFFFSQTTTLASVYGDAGLTAQISNPVFAASDGRFPIIYMDPSIPYRVQLLDRNGNLLEDTDPYVLPPTIQAVQFAVEADFANPANNFGADLVANGVRTYDTVADLKAAPVPILATGETRSVIVQGLTVPNDNGGGIFMWNPTVANLADDGGVTTIIPNALVAIPGSAGRYLRQFASSLGTFSISFNGGPSGNVSYTRVGNLVNIWSNASIVGNSTGIVSSSPLPSSLACNTINPVVPCYSLLNGAGVFRSGLCSISQSLSLSLLTVTGSNVTTGNFTSSTNCGIGPGWTITYSTN